MRGLRWLNPTMAPVIEQYHKMIRGGTTVSSSSRQSRGKAGHSSGLGRLWLRQSLLAHNLANQLQILTGSKEHLQQYYYGKSTKKKDCVRPFQTFKKHLFVSSVCHLYLVHSNRRTVHECKGLCACLIISSIKGCQLVPTTQWGKNVFIW